MRKLLKRICIFFVAVFFLAAAVIGAGGYGMYRKALDKKSMFAMQEEIQAKDSYVSLEELPRDYIDSVVAVEDKRFYRHKGIDMIAIGRALCNDIRAGALVEGGSTITQQLAKNQYFTQEKKLSRKAAELFMAVEMEEHFSKDEILELYVNSIYFGNGYYGVREASLGYYGKEPEALTQEECMMLAGIPNAPSVYNPVDNRELAQERLAQVQNLIEKTD